MIISNELYTTTFRMSRSAMKRLNDIKPRYTGVSEIMRKLIMLYITREDIRADVQSEARQTLEAPEEQG